MVLISNISVERHDSRLDFVQCLSHNFERNRRYPQTKIIKKYNIRINFHEISINRKKTFRPLVKDKKIGGIFSNFSFTKRYNIIVA